MKKNLLMMLIVLGLAVSAQAVTICETFDVDPLTHGWTKIEAGNNQYVYQPTSRLPGGTSGWLQGTNNMVEFSRYQTDLSSYGLTTADEFWMEFDLHISDLNDYGAARSLVGTGQYSTEAENPIGKLANAITTYHTRTGTNTTGEYFQVYANYTNAAGSRDICEATDSGDNYYLPWAGYSYGTAADLYLRVKFHAYPDPVVTGQTQVDMGIYDLLGDPFTDLMAHTTNNIDRNVEVPDGAAFALNWFGIGGHWGGSSTATAFQTWEYDNLYFSTDQANCLDVQADFVPEPATLALFGLGALALRRRKQHA